MDKFAKAQLKAIDIVGYYMDYIPWIGSLLTPITIFIAAVYVCSRMAGRTEVIAMLSAGISFKRMLFPYFIGATLVGIISFVLNGWIIPNSNKSRLAFEMQYFKTKYYFEKQNIHIQVASDTYLYMKSYNNNNQTGYHFTLEKFHDNKLVEKLTASRVAWDTTKMKWVLFDWSLKKVDGIFESPKRPEAIPAFEVSKVATAKEFVESGTTMDTALVIHPKEF